MIDQQRILRLLLNRARDALSVLRAEDERAEDEEIERALQDRDALLFRLSGRHTTGVCTRSGRESTRATETPWHGRRPILIG
jgi:hypothetical protein